MVVEDADDNRDVVLDGCGEFAQVQHEAAVPLDEDGLLAGANRRADRQRKPGADGV